MHRAMFSFKTLNEVLSSDSIYTQEGKLEIYIPSLNVRDCRLMSCLQFFNGSHSEESVLEFPLN